MKIASFKPVNIQLGIREAGEQHRIEAAAEVKSHRIFKRCTLFAAAPLNAATAKTTNCLRKNQKIKKTFIDYSHFQTSGRFKFKHIHRR